MNMAYSCRCCLRCSPDKDLTTPYIYLGKTEIYAEMLKDCFDLQLTLGGSGSCGICSMCVGRLRDASDFKLQVQRSQAELQAWLQGAVFVKEEPVKIEIAVDVLEGQEDDTEFDALDEEPVQKTEVSEYEIGEVLDEDPLVKPDTSGNVVMKDSSKTAEAGEPPAPLSQRHLAAACRVGRFLHQLRHKPPPCNSKTPARYQCHHCGRTSPKKTLLTKHIEKMHSGNTYKCGFCHYNFKYKSALREHEMTHTGEKPYQCSYCDYKTRINSNLKSHLRIHTGEKPFKCDKCVYKCTRKSVLKRHMMTHTGEKPYECKYCDYKCSDQTNMKTHEMAHTGEKPYECSDSVPAHAIEQPADIRPVKLERPCSDEENTTTHSEEKSYALPLRLVGYASDKDSNESDVYMEGLDIPLAGSTAEPDERVKFDEDVYGVVRSLSGGHRMQVMQQRQESMTETTTLFYSKFTTTSRGTPVNGYSADDSTNDKV
ncbi:zinc finger protein 729-like [Cydia amplana]|uniref:zinc finger protein 729-like n=1 Tax=Cydia amplana TaxID=1869771 RepID=UPI002FE68106